MSDDTIDRLTACLWSSEKRNERLRAELADMAQALEDVIEATRREQCPNCGHWWSGPVSRDSLNCPHYCCNEGGLLACCACLCGKEEP